MPRPQLTLEEKDEFRGRTCKKALEVILDYGVDGLTFRELGKRLDCSYAKPYRYFGDKSRLIDAVRAHAFNHFSAFMSGEDPESQSVELFNRYLRFAKTQPAAFEIMFGFSQTYVSAETREAENKAWKICAQPFHDAVANGTMVGDPEKIAHIAWVTLHGLSALTLSNQLTHGVTESEISKDLQKWIENFGTAKSLKPAGLFKTKEHEHDKNWSSLSSS